MGMFGNKGPSKAEVRREEAQRKLSLAQSRKLNERDRREKAEKVEWARKILVGEPAPARFEDYRR